MRVQVELNLLLVFISERTGWRRGRICSVRQTWSELGRGLGGGAFLLMASHRSGKQKGPNLSFRNTEDVEENDLVRPGGSVPQDQKRKTKHFARL